MSRTITTTKERTPSSEFRDKLLGLINDHEKRKDIELIDGDRFIEELSRQFRKIGQFERLLYKHENEDLLASSINMDKKTRELYDIIDLLRN